MAKKSKDNGYIDEDKVNRLVAKYLKNVTDAMIKYMEDDVTIIPVDTHNLKDALGVAVYSNGRLMYLGTSSRAVTPQATEARKNVWVDDRNFGTLSGRVEISSLLQDGVEKYSQGLWIVLLSAMPYDEYQDSQGVNEGWFSIELGSKFRAITEQVMELYGKK